MPEPRRPEPVDLYEVLEISPRASLDVVQAAYRTLARKYHPDVNATPEATFRIRQLNEAHAVLSDTEARARYDFECMRARRYERLIHSDDASVMSPMASGVLRSRALRVRPSLASQALQPHGHVLSGQAILGLILVAALAASVLVVLWATLDVAADASSVYTGPTVEWAGR